MGKTRVWTLGFTAMLTVAATGCTHLVHHEDIEGMMDPVNAQLAEHEGQISALQSDVAGLQSDVAELRAAMDQLRSDFGAHVSDEDMHGAGMAVSLPVHFDFDSSELRDVDRPLLDAFAAAVTGTYPSARVTVEGSADQAGSAAYNQRLSQQRAENVRDYLVSEGGMNADQIEVVALGESRLMNQETGVQNPQSGIENRRVTFVLEWAGPGTTN
ncbi:MAG: OmpA family protein [Gemmatimonadota bacterium]|nr:OmpA family protein [Gemmatimonadota bacterium]